MRDIIIALKFLHYQVVSGKMNRKQIANEIKLAVNMLDKIEREKQS
jgi:hypothetical protein